MFMGIMVNFNGCMAGFNLFLTIFGLIFVLRACQGQIIPPPGGDKLSILLGSNATIAWSTGDPDRVVGRVWTFFGNKTILIATSGVKGANLLYFSSGLDGVKIQGLDTLVLMNVNQSYDGIYRFTILHSITGSHISDVRVIIAVTPSLSINCSRVTTVNTSDEFTCVCKGKDGHPPAQVTWYKGNKTMSTGVEEATLHYNNVNKNDSGNYTCEAKSHEKAKNETEIELIVNYPPEGTSLRFSYVNESVIVKCAADSFPPSSFKILFNGSKLTSKKTYKIPKVTKTSVGNYTCFAENILGQEFSQSHILSILENKPKSTMRPFKSSKGQPTFSMTSIKMRPSATITSLLPSTTTPPTRDGSGEISEHCNSKTEWYIVVVSLASGFIVGIVFSYIVFRCRRKFRTRKPKLSKPEHPTSQMDSPTYQELDLTKMNTEDNYQSLRGNVARNDGVNNDDTTYTELNKTRDLENNYQSLTLNH